MMKQHVLNPEGYISRLISKRRLLVESNKLNLTKQDQTPKLNNMLISLENSSEYVKKHENPLARRIIIS